MEKNNSIIKSLLIVFVITTVTLSVYIVYDKLIKKENKGDNTWVECFDESCKKEEPKNDAWELFAENMIKNRKVSVEYDNGIEIVMDKDGNVYYSGTMDENAVGTKGNYKIDGYDGGIDIQTNEMSHTIDGYKLPITNVITYYYGVFGNGGYKDYVFIKADGTIAMLTYSSIPDSDGKFVERIQEFKDNVSGYKKIVGMIQANGFGGHGYKLYDIYGNVY